MPLDQPSGVVSLVEFKQRLPQFLDGLEGADAGGLAFDAEKRQLVLEVPGYVLRPIILAHCETPGDALGEAAEVAARRPRRMGSSASKRVARIAEAVRIAYLSQPVPMPEFE